VFHKPLVSHNHHKPTLGKPPQQTTTKTRSYTATFKAPSPTTPCGTPLSATNTARLVLDNAGGLQAPPPATTTVAVTFDGCTGGAAAAAASPGGAPQQVNTATAAGVGQAPSGVMARFGQVVPITNVEAAWNLVKTSNATSVVLQRGELGGVLYQVKVARAPPRPRYAVSGTVAVLPGGSSGPAMVSTARVRLSSGDAAPAVCVLVPADNSTVCRFERLAFTQQAPPAGVAAAAAGGAPVSATATAEIALTNGQRLTAGPAAFDFPALSQVDRQAANAFATAALTDSLITDEIDAAAAAGIQLEIMNLPGEVKPPAVGEGAPLIINSTRAAFNYTLRVGGGRRCGSWGLTNTARLAPIGEVGAGLFGGPGGEVAVLEERSDLTIVVEGCPMPLDATMGLIMTNEVGRRSFLGWPIRVARWDDFGGKWPT
jgi:hypothetical protein